MHSVPHVQSTFLKMLDSNPAENPSCSVLQLLRVETQSLPHTAASASSLSNGKILQQIAILLSNHDVLYQVGAKTVFPVRRADCMSTVALIWIQCICSCGTHKAECLRTRPHDHLKSPCKSLGSCDGGQWQSIKTCPATHCSLHRNGRKTIRELIVITSSSLFGNLLSSTYLESETS
jgi:hypothetical protein